MESKDIVVAGYNEDQISGHIKMLLGGGLVEVKDESEGEYAGINLTWNGQDFLDASNDSSIWQKAKETVLKPTVSITFTLLLEWLKQEAKIKLGLP